MTKPHSTNPRRSPHLTAKSPASVSKDSSQIAVPGPGRPRRLWSGQWSLASSRAGTLPPATSSPRPKGRLHDPNARANGLALLAALAWGVGNVSQKTILEHMDAFAATGTTSLVGAVLLLPLARREANRMLPAVKGSLPLLLTVSTFFTFAATVMQFGYGQTTVTNAGAFW